MLVEKCVYIVLLRQKNLSRNFGHKMHLINLETKVEKSVKKFTRNFHVRFCENYTKLFFINYHKFCFFKYGSGHFYNFLEMICYLKFIGVSHYYILKRFELVFNLSLACVLPLNKLTKHY